MLETTTPLVGPDELVGFLARSAQAWDEIAPETDRDTVVVFGLLEAAARTWRSVHSGVLARFELNLAEWTTIGMLRTSPPDFRRSPTELRHLVGQTSAGMTRVLTKLADARLVRREPRIPRRPTSRRPPHPSPARSSPRSRSARSTQSNASCSRRSRPPSAPG